MSSIFRTFMANPAFSPTTPASCRPALQIARSPTSTATKGVLLLPRLSDRAAGRAIRLPRSRLSAARTASCPRKRRMQEFEDRITRHTMLTRADEPLLLTASAATPTRWRSCAAWSARWRPSITTPPTSTIRASAMIASLRLIAKMPTIAAMAYKYSIGQPFIYPQQRPRLRRELPAHDASPSRARNTRSSPVLAGRWTAS